MQLIWPIEASLSVSFGASNSCTYPLPGTSPQSPTSPATMVLRPPGSREDTGSALSAELREAGLCQLLWDLLPPWLLPYSGGPSLLNAGRGLLARHLFPLLCTHLEAGLLASQLRLAPCTEHLTSPFPRACPRRKLRKARWPPLWLTVGRAAQLCGVLLRNTRQEQLLPPPRSQGN